MNKTFIFLKLEFILKIKNNVAYICVDHFRKKNALRCFGLRGKQSYNCMIGSQSGFVF